MIAEIEQAIIDRITAANDAGDVLGYKLKKIATWGGDNSNDLRHLVKDFPAVWVIFAGDEPAKHTTKAQYYKARFNIIVAAQSLRNEKEARHGKGSQHVGSYQIIKDVRALILNNSLGLDIKPIKAGRTTPLLNENAKSHMASMYGIEVSTIYSVSQVGDTASLDDFDNLHLNWDIPPHGNVGSIVPDDENADATDNIILGA